jgi:hypothetical protein
MGLIASCPKHNSIGLFIPGYIYTKSSRADQAVVEDANADADADADTECCHDCIDCARDTKARNDNIYNIRLLQRLHSEFKELDPSVYEDVDLSSRCKMFQHLLEYIIRNYVELHNADLSLFERLQMTYLNSSKACSSSVMGSISRGIEIIPVIEEQCNHIERLDTICENIDIASVPDTFMIAFYSSVRDFVKDAKAKILGLKKSIY